MKKHLSLAEKTKAMKRVNFKKMIRRYKSEMDFLRRMSKIDIKKLNQPIN